MNDRRRNTVRIDYDKLAEAIVKAQSKNNKAEIKNAIVEANKEIKQSKPEFKNSREFIKFAIQPMLWIIIALGVAGAIGTLIYLFKNFKTFDFNSISSFIVLIFCLVIFMVSGSISVFGYLSLKEVEESNDFNFLSTYIECKRGSSNPV